MPNNEIEKTKWTLRRLPRWGVFALVAAFLAVLFVVYVRIQSTYRLTVYVPHEVLNQSWTHETNPKSLKPWVYYLDAARTSAKQEKGLGDREKLRFNAGMIFIYDNTANRCFWMKDMRFSIDIIWVDDTKKVTAIEHNVNPKTYPDAFCHDAQYVIELNAGEAKKADLKQGQQLTF